jgi:putative DNA primase/helicase
MSDEPNVMELHPEAEINRVAQLSTLDYERERETIAKRLSIRLHVLDEMVARARQKTAADPSLTSLPAVETVPWPEPVNGAQLLDDITAAVRRYVVLEKGAAEATALWVVHTYCFDAFAISPRLAITSAVMRCGKTTLLDVLSCLVHRPISTGNATAAAIYRLVHKIAPTLLIDEADTFLVGNAALRGILNSGYRKNTAFVMRADETFSTWAPAAIAMIGRLPSTLEDRSIWIQLQRRRADEPIEAFRLDQRGDLNRFARMAARFAADNFDELKSANPSVPRTLENREADNWLPLIAIADAAGGAWPSIARQVAEHLALLNRATEQSVAVMLLEDIHSVLATHTGERIQSADLVKALAQLEDRSWADWKGGKVITPNAIAHLLAPFNIKPFQMRTGSHVLRGYRLAQFEDAFARYVEAAGVQAATPLQPADQDCLEDN